MRHSSQYSRRVLTGGYFLTVVVTNVVGFPKLYYKNASTASWFATHHKNQIKIGELLLSPMEKSENNSIRVVPVFEDSSCLISVGVRIVISRFIHVIFSLLCVLPYPFAVKFHYSHSKESF